MVNDRGSVSLPRSSNRTCGFPASGFPTGFTASPRQGSIRAMAISPFRLRVAAQLARKDPGLSWCFAGCRQSPTVTFFTSTPEVRALPSTGVTRLHRHYGPVRPPHRPATKLAVEAATLVKRGSPPLARSPVSTCCSHYPGGPIQCTRRLLPRPCCLPLNLGGSASTTSLSRPAQALLTLRPVDLLDRPRRPSSQGFDPASYPTKPPASYRANRPLPGWDFHPQGDRTLRGAPDLHR